MLERGQSDVGTGTRMTLERRTKHSHTNPSYESSGSGRVDAEVIVMVVAGSQPGGSAGRRYREVAGRRMVGDKQDQETRMRGRVERRQTATSTGRQGSGTEGFWRSLGVRRGR